MSLKTATFLIFTFVLLVIAIYSGTLIWITWPISTNIIEKLGAFGDSFGIVNSLFSGLAFAGLIITILLQRLELNESRKIFKKQRFEDGFYRLLDFYQRNLNAIGITNHETNEQFKGIDAIAYLQRKLTISMSNFQHYLSEEDTKQIYEYYLFVEIQKILIRQSRYLGTLESILNLIDDDIESDYEKEVYWRILCSQITAIEIKYIFYQCLVAPEGNNLRSLIQNAKLFEFHATGLSINKSLSKIYEKAHGIKYTKNSSKPILPYSRNEIRKIKHKHRDKMRLNKKLL